MITEFYTSADFKPTRTVAEYAVEGEAFVVTKGDAVGSKSVMLPVAIIGIALVIAGSIGGTYGIAIAALGMLSFVGTTVSIDAFGPIADNAGGLAESCHLDPEVRQITDKLDSVGNTTAAIKREVPLHGESHGLGLFCVGIGKCNMGAIVHLKITSHIHGSGYIYRGIGKSIGDSLALDIQVCCFGSGDGKRTAVHLQFIGAELTGRNKLTVHRKRGILATQSNPFGANCQGAGG